ncbi:MAG: hypothetical protein LBR48_06460 [Dysgonamonadaceae bacterium]|nr:hypothetical protein [Dysgonamonadaceae bacterium]
MDYFFDNMEYSRSSYASSQTLNGIWFKPLVGYSVDSIHSLYGGFDVLKIPGTSAATIEKTGLTFDLTLFYEYKTTKTLFRAGAFPREEALANYSDFFFTDSVRNFKPLVRGLFWQVGNKDKFFNAWMDWTGYPSDSVRESFFLGLSGKIAYNVFFVDFQSCLFHYANTSDHDFKGVSENFQIQSSAGVEITAGENFNALIAAGVLAGYERDRAQDKKPYLPLGFTACVQAEYMGIGTKNMFYAGDPRMKYYNRYRNGLYWGTPFLRDPAYLKNSWYARLIDSKFATARLDLNLHFSEKNVFFEQLFTVIVSFDNFTNRKQTKRVFPWLKIFQ